MHRRQTALEPGGLRAARPGTDSANHLRVARKWKSHLAAATASAAAVASAAAKVVAATTAAAQDEDDDNDPPATTAAKTIVEHIHVLHSAAAQSA